MLAETTQQWLWTAGWPAWVGVCAAATACWGVFWLYRLERRIVSRRAGVALTALRVLIVLALLAMLGKPVLRRQRQWDEPATLVLLIDRSASMHIADRQAESYERLRLAEMLSVPGAKRRHRLDVAASELAQAATTLSTQRDFLARVAPAARNVRQEQLGRRRQELLTTVETIRKQLAEQAERCGAPLTDGTIVPAETRTGLLDIKTRLADIDKALLEAAVALEPAGAGALADDADALLKVHRRATGSLAKAAEVADALGRALDEQMYHALGDPARQTVDAVCELTRLEVVDVLLNRPPLPIGEAADPPEALLATLSESYRIKAYAYDGTCQPIDAATLSAREATVGDNGNRTDLAGALRHAQQDLAGKRIAAVIVCTDGRNNTGDDPVAIVRALAAAGTPVVGVMVGSRRPPTDAAIVALEAPDTIRPHDAFTVGVDLKLHGLAGRPVRVALLDGDDETDAIEITPPARNFRTRIRLGDTPTEAGPRTYRVAIRAIDGEVFADNNARELVLDVRDERTHVLLVDHRPRWEYRYLRNLFASRDRAVHLQHVLLAPAGIAGQRPQRPRPAAVTNKFAEATALPASPAEWLKFDVVILGDIPPEQLDPATRGALERFVGDRGGTLVVIGGPRAMPHAYRGAALAELLPVTIPPPSKKRPAGVSERFALALTPQGRGSEVTRLVDDAEQNIAVWRGFQKFGWRCEIGRLKPAAKVLCYAADPAEQGGRWNRRRREDAARRAVVATGKYGLGKVLLVGIDATWRLRYREGDTYHGRFWTQVLRWATAGKLPAGTALVKLGADQRRYAPHARPVLRAQILGSDLSPVTNERVRLKLFRNGDEPVRESMHYLPGSPGFYEVKLPPLESGSYRAVLDAPAAEPMLSGEKVDEVAVAFVVDPASPTEQIELAADPGLLGKLAAQSPAGRVLVPPLARYLPGALPEHRQEMRDVTDRTLWDSWHALLVIGLAATAEWLLRKRVGLV